MSVPATSTTVSAAGFYQLKSDLCLDALVSMANCPSHVKQCSAKSVTVQESEPAKPPVNLEEIRAELKAKIEEEAYNKG